MRPPRGLDKSASKADSKSEENEKKQQGSDVDEGLLKQIQGLELTVISWFIQSFWRGIFLLQFLKRRTEWICERNAGFFFLKDNPKMSILESR